MRWIGLFGACIVLASVGCSQTEMVGTLHGFKVKGWAKAENGLVLSWQAKIDDPMTDQINVSDLEGHQIMNLKVLSAVPDAAKAYISDVSAPWRTGRGWAVLPQQARSPQCPPCFSPIVV